MIYRRLCTAAVVCEEGKHKLLVVFQAGSVVLQNYIPEGLSLNYRGCDLIMGC